MSEFIHRNDAGHVLAEKSKPVERQPVSGPPFCSCGSTWPMPPLPFLGCPSCKPYYYVTVERKS